MESITFKSRQQFLSEFFNEDRVDFLSVLRTKKIINYRYRNSVPFRDEMIFFNIDAEVTFKKLNDELHIPFKNYINLLKPFIYFLYSLSKYEKFLEEHILYISSLDIRFCLKENNFNGVICFPDLRDNDGFKFLNSFTISDFTKGINEISIKLSTYYMDISEIDFIRLGGLAEDITTHLQRKRSREYYQLQQEEELERETEEELVQRLLQEAEEELVQRLQQIPRDQLLQEEGETILQQLREEEQRERIINASECFKSEECVICYTNPPNVLFCNCGHICFCSECEKLKNSNLCPICKIENKIIRILN